MWQYLVRVNHVLTQSLMGINCEPFKITTPHPLPLAAGEIARQTLPYASTQQPFGSNARFDASRIAFHAALTILADLISVEFLDK